MLTESEVFTVEYQIEAFLYWPSDSLIIVWYFLLRKWIQRQELTFHYGIFPLAFFNFVKMPTTASSLCRFLLFRIIKFKKKIWTFFKDFEIVFVYMVLTISIIPRSLWRNLTTSATNHSARFYRKQPVPHYNTL